MNRKNLVRELQKAQTTLAFVSKNLESVNEANAALHLSEKVMYSPLAFNVNELRQSFSILLNELQADDSELVELA